MGRGTDGESVDGKVSRTTSRYEDAVATICLGVLLIGVGCFIALRTPDLGETLARNGLPTWAFVGLLGVGGLISIIGGSIMLLVRRIRKGRQRSERGSH